MKQFQFSLDKVLTYKEQIEENLRNEQAELLHRIASEERRLQDLHQEYSDYAEDLQLKKEEGCTVPTMQMYEAYMVNLDFKIRRSQQVIENLRRREEEKRQEVIQAKVERSSIEKIKEKRFNEYGEEVRKAEERFIEEFVSNVNTRTAVG